MGEPPLTVTRCYWPAHNIGCFRYLDCSHRDADGRPAGDIMLWDEILFPFDPTQAGWPDLTGVPIRRLPLFLEEEIEEIYSVDASGTVAVAIANVSAGYARRYRLGRWATGQEAVEPSQRRRAAGAAGGL